MSTDTVLPQSTSVIICCYTTDRWDDLCTAVESVRRQLGSDGELIVCVDHNTALFDRARIEFSSTRVIQNTQSPGLSGARNCAVAEATGQIVVFLDDDAAPGPGWLAALVGPFAHRNVKAVGGTAEPSWPQRRPGWFPSEFDWVVGCSYRGLPARRTPIRNVMGCNMAIHRSVFEAGLRFETSVGRTATSADGCEETMLCIRLRQMWPDAEVLFEPKATVRHRVPAQRCSWSYFARRCYAEGRSKARVSAFVGSTDALQSEWTYTRRVLPTGIRRGLRDAAMGKASGLGRSGAIVAGLGITSLGYLRGRYGR